MCTLLYDHITTAGCHDNCLKIVWLLEGPPKPNYLNTRLGKEKLMVFNAGGLTQTLMPWIVFDAGAMTQTLI